MAPGLFVQCSFTCDPIFASYLPLEDSIFPQISGYLVVLQPQFSDGFKQIYDFVTTLTLFCVYVGTKALSSFLHPEHKQHYS